MKTLEILTLRAMQTLSFALGAITLIALVYAVTQLILGNYSGTACREF
jgi:hypothetical protein